MKNSSGAIGAAKAPPYLVSHRRIINVIRIMYPRNSDRQGSPAGLRRKKGGMGYCGGRDAYLCCGIYRRGTSRQEGKGKEMERGGGRCVYKGNADGALTIVHPDRGVYSPSSTLEPRTPRCQAHVFCICRFLCTLQKETAVSTCVAIRIHISAMIFGKI